MRDGGALRAGLYRVYVIELSDAAGTRRDAALANLYVGQTALSPEERFQQHRAGVHASRWVRRFGVALRPDLYATLPFVRERAQAEELERRTAAELRRRGHRVFSN